MSPSKRDEDRSRVDGFEMEISKLVKDEATSKQRKQQAGLGHCERTLLGAAACGNKTRGADDASKALVMAGADPNLGNADGDSPLHLAAEAGHHRVIVILLLRKKAQAAAPRNVFLETPRQIAAAMGHTLCISELLMGGADRDVDDGKGETPLFKAAANNHLGAIQELLAAGADQSILTMSYRSPLQAAASRVDATDNRGWTALHCAAYFDRPVHDNGDAVRALLEAGADVNVKNDAHVSDDIFTPLHVAVSRPMASICTIRALLEGWADVNVRDDCNQTPLHVACMWGDLSGVELLLRWGADEMLKKNRVDTPADVIGVWGDEDRNDEEIEADNQRIRPVLARAAADRSWHRRDWLVLSRSCPTRVHIACRSSSSSSGSSSKVARVSVDDSDGNDM
ncbi:unnamed protein product [Ectocarpus sp. CCAP 1310/34]|nr:unnamed protein product [Ectocarpus sp. CCAP 1310/34]